MRINKFISEQGICSRREADKLIESGKVTINGKKAELGSIVEESDSVKVKGKLLIPQKKDRKVYLAFNKPVGIICTTDSGEPNNIIDFIHFPMRIFHIGRLDKDSEGLIFLTNDGDIVNSILRSGNDHEKEYIVTVKNELTPEFIQKMRDGVKILGRMTKKCQVNQMGKNKFRIILTQGMNRQIRRMCESLGYEVSTLKRVRIMNVKLGDLSVGQWRYFAKEELSGLKALLADKNETD